MLTVTQSVCCVSLFLKYILNFTMTVFVKILGVQEAWSLGVICLNTVVFLWILVNKHSMNISSNRNTQLIFSSPEPKAQGELIVWDSSRRLSIRVCVRPSSLSNINISETSWPIIIKFHQEHHWGGGSTVVGFG